MAAAAGLPGSLPPSPPRCILAFDRPNAAGVRTRSFHSSESYGRCELAASSKVRAADCILDHAAKGIELEDIEARVPELERQVRESNPLAEID